MSNKQEVGSLLLRVMLGMVFLAHGAAKFQGGIENIVGWFDSIGLPGFLAYVVAILELVGGIALILGVGTRIVSALLALLLVGAILKVQLAAGFIGGYAYDLVLLVISVHLFLNGSKLYSVGHLLFKGEEVQHSYKNPA
ncbi:DoxX family protein [Halalkalibacter alkalisediminis]|uniref:DoxX family protein n=1 Tax=Halalkalibacter alkalisediminis TaxID=935616 RepID=A0ABV6NJ04_9BACI|nr:DoxX family protein [Halalkalibacter alkalisediminis]